MYDFDKIASTYDRLNHLMTLGVDRRWRRKAVRAMADPSRPQQMLDVATGTGDVALALLGQAHPESRLVGVDISEQMLAVARRKLQGRNCELLQADAERLPFADSAFDCVSVAFGVRNFVHLEQGLREMCRVLKPGGRLVVLELSSPDNPLLLALYKVYTLHFIPLLGQAISGDRPAYRYLAQSVLRFPKPAAFMPLLRRCGFSEVRHTPFAFGACRMYVAVRPRQ